MVGPPSDNGRDRDSSNGNGNGNGKNPRMEHDDVSMHPRKRKLRPRTDPSQSTESQLFVPLHHEKPDNPFQLYMQIRRQVRKIEYM